MKKKDLTPHGTPGNLKYWSKNRSKIGDLYKSEKYFFLRCLKNSSSFLDVGCAAGNFTKIIETRKKRFTYLGLDISNNLINLAKKKYPKYNFKVVRENGFGKLKKKFNLAFAFGTLHHSQHYLKIIIDMLKCSNKYVLFDLRLVNSSSTNSLKQYQLMKFGNNQKNISRVRYITLNQKKIIKKIVSITKKKYDVSVFSYWNKVSNTYVGKHKKVLMATFLIDKSKNFNPRSIVKLS